MSDALPWRTAWITGASTGIGRAVALALAAQGVKVAISARSADKLAEVVAVDPRIAAYPLDVTDRAAVAATHARIEAEIGPLDLAILNAGTWDPMGASDFDAERIARSMAVNHGGIAAALEPLIPAMIARRSGQIALVASVAGYRGLPRAAAYAPTKAAIICLAEVLRPDLARKGVTVSLVNPGFVDTPMTAVNDFPMPFMVSSEEAARRIIKGLATKRFEVVFPWRLAILMKLLRVLPYRVFFALTARMLGR